MPFAPKAGFVALLCVLAGCGGGGGSSTPSMPPAPSLELLAGSAPGIPQAAGHVDGVGSAARFSGISDIAVDDAGNVFVLEGAQAGNHAIRRITPAGVVTTIFDYGPDPAVELHGLVVDGSGNLYTGFSLVCRFDITLDTCLHSGQLHRITPQGVRAIIQPSRSSDGTGTLGIKITTLALDPRGNLYFSGGLDAYRLSPDGDMTTALLGGNSHMPAAMAVSESGTVYAIGGVGLFNVYRVAGDGPLPLVPQMFSPLSSTSGMAIAQGNFYFSDVAKHTVWELSGGMLSVVVGNGNKGFVPGPLPGGLDAPRGLAIHGTDLYVGMDTAVAVVHNRP